MTSRIAYSEGPRERRLMDCMGCHNRPTMPMICRAALNRAMFARRVEPYPPLCAPSGHGDS